MKTRYIHIGYPKNLSTSLQRDFFGKHPELRHLGVGCGDNNLGYIDDETSLYVEFYLRYAKDYVFDEKKDLIKDHFDRHFDAAEQDENIKATGISGEHMCFNFTPDNIDVSQKAQRLQGIFGSDTKVIMIVRNQLDLIKSFYNECVRVGYPKSYAEYIEYMFMFHERNFVSDFFYGNAYDLYAQLFGEQNICVLTMEEIRQQGDLVKNNEGKQVILERISKHLGISYPEFKLGHHNQALGQSVIVHTRNLNAKNPHDLGNTIYGTAESHRILNRFIKEMKVEPPDEAKNDVLTKRRVIGEAIELSKNSEHEIVDYSCDSEIYKKLGELFFDTNEKFSLRTGIDLKTLGYPIK